MGLLDLPGPLFDAIDGWLTVLPPWLRVVLWGGVSGALSMWLYKLISPQQRIGRATGDQRDARRRLGEFDGELGDAWPLIRNLLGVSLRRVGQVTGPALVASIPVLCVLVWLSTAYGHRFPADPPPVDVQPAPLSGHWVNGSKPGVVVTGSDGAELGRVSLPAPVPVVEKRRWWNVLIGNPAGYLSPASPVERVLVDLPRRQVLPFGPAWLRGWELPFFAALLATSLALKRALRIH